MNTNYLKLAFTGFCSLVLLGCISQKSSVIQDVPRTKVEFENETAARLFNETLQRNAGSYKDTQTTSVDLPLIYHHEKKVVTGPNSAFNRAVEICDTNKDGKITEAEARAYNEQYCKRL